MGFRKRPQKYDVIWGRKRLRKFVKAENKCNNFQIHRSIWLIREDPASEEWWRLLRQIIRADDKLEKKRRSAYRKTPDKLIKRYNKKRWKI